MSRWLKITMLLLLVFTSIPTSPVSAQIENPCQFYGLHGKGAKYCITTPPPGYWNGDLVIFAHGYVPANMPVDIPWGQMQLPGITLPELVNSLGYAFATTSYSENGLAVVRGVIDILDLVEVFKQTVGTPSHVYLVGASEGGLVTTLAVENHPGVFAGGMAMCGPIGDFRGQVNYWGDFRVLFDYFLPGVLPPSPVSIPQTVMDNWSTYYAPGIMMALSNPANMLQVQQLMNVSQAPFDMQNPNTIGETVLGILWYNAFATNNAIEKLSGQPFDNQNRTYLGSFNDPLLNQSVQRFAADKLALNRIDKKYETSGRLKKPLIVLHTSGDPIVPDWHAELYSAKVSLNGMGGPYQAVMIPRYGHCSFTLNEILDGFGWLVAHTGQKINRGDLKLDPSRANELYHPDAWLLPVP